MMTTKNRYDQLIDLENFKEQCYLDTNDDSQDRYLKSLIYAAISHAENYTNRVFFGSSDEMTGADNEMIITPDIEVAIMLLAAGWYENRENMNTGEVKSIPFGFEAIMYKYKYIPM